jgi:phage terminase small subunit
MGEVVGHAAVIAYLTAAGVRLDVATQYADAFTDYHEAAANIREHGAIVAHPRTHNPMPNPYLDVRDRARATLQKLNVRQGAGLWENG